MVCSGEVGGRLSTAQVLAVELREHPELGAQLRVMDPGPAGIQPVVAASSLPDELTAAIRAALMAYGRRPGGQGQAGPRLHRTFRAGHR